MMMSVYVCVHVSCSGDELLALSAMLLLMV
jgi:hypothetical protein